MKKLAVLSALFVAATASAQSVQRIASETQALTRAAPSAANMADTSIALDLDDVTFFYVEICAESTRTLTNVVLDAYVMDKRTQLVAKDPLLQLTATSVGVRCMAFPDQEVGVDIGRSIMYASNGTTVSAGTTVTVYLRAVVRKGARR